MSRLIDADKLSADMYHEAFEKDSDMQKWDSGCWIRYKMFENVLKAQPTVEAPDINVGNMDTTTHGSNVVKKGGNDEDRTSGDCISRQATINVIKKRLYETAFNNAGIKQDIDETLVDVAENRLKNWFDELLSAEQDAPDINVGNMDAISRQAAKDIFTELYGISAIGSVFDKYEWADICETTANELPSIQPDIIHCKDCKYWTHIKRTNRYWCKTDDGLFDLNPSPDDFCSRGERKTDERLDKQTAGD